MDDPVTRYEEAVEALVRDPSRENDLAASRPGGEAEAGGAPPPGGRRPDKASAGLAGRVFTPAT